MPRRISAADPGTARLAAGGAAVPVRVVVVTMDSHLASAAARAEASLREALPGLRLAVHAADEWDLDPSALDRCRADIARGDIVIATMLFLDEHIRAVLPALLARREGCDAMVGCLSAPEVVKLTRMGKLSMAGEQTGALAWLKRLRGSGKGQPASGEKQMRMLRRMPKLLRFIPGTAQDLRCYFLSLQYWLAGSEQNLANLVRMLVSRYGAGERAALRGTLSAGEPVHYPEVGLYHPRAKQRISESLDALPSPPAGEGGPAKQGRMRGGAPNVEVHPSSVSASHCHLLPQGEKENAGTVGLLVMRSYVLAGNSAHYDGVIAALEARGLRVVPAFSSGLDQRPAIERFFMRDGVPAIDALVSLTGFSLVGGPAYNDAKGAEEILAKLDVPYLAAHPVEFQTLEQWAADARGLTPVEATMMVAIPELDGAISPMTFGGRSTEAPNEGRRDMAPHRERAEALASRVARLVALRHTARADRRLGIVLFNFPPNSGATGTAAYLSVFESLLNTLKALKAAGYGVELPADLAELKSRILEGNAARFGADANVAARIPVESHVRRERHLAEIERQWGPAPGRHNTDGSSLLVLGAEFGNVFVGVQPAFGYEGDPMRLLFEGSFAPTHAFSAFYRWLREDFTADAVLHFGTHGALEFMPGKQAGLSGACWPDRLIGDLPNVYLYASNNPSEGALAKRRTGATLISYLTPPVAAAGLYRGLLDLKSSLDRWRGLEPDATEEARTSLATLIQAQAASVELAAAEPAWIAGEAEPRIRDLTREVLELEYTLIPHGLHVVGETLDPAARTEMLQAAGVTEATEHARLDALLARDHELPALVHALDGGYTRPVPGGDLLRTTAVLPTGRNLHGFDPFRIPSAFALRDGAAQADKLLARHRAESGALPETVAMVLWGTDNLKTEGGPIGQALWLMGAEPRHDSYGRLAGAQLVPLERLGRPRIDVVVTLSGIFRDLLPMQTRLLAEAAQLAAAADEPVAMNFVRKHALAFQAEQGGSLEEASLRVFGNAEGAYGANVNHLVDSGGWQDEDELAEAYLRRKGFAYGTDGRPARHDAVLAHVLSKVDVTYQNLDSVELGVTTVDHYFDTLGGISRAVKQARGASAAIYIGDQTRGDGTVRTLSEQVSLETRTRALNPKWYEALLAHGYEGVRHIEAQVTNTMGWSATTGQVQPWIYEKLTETFVLDPAMQERLATLNPKASARVANRLIEAHERHYWTPDEATLSALRRASDDLEDRLEGVGVAA